MSIDKKSLNREFDDALDELEITYDVYFEIEGYRRRCVHIVRRVLLSGMNQGKVLVFGLNYIPFTMLFEKLGFQIEGITLHQTSESDKENGCKTQSAVIDKIRGLQDEYDIIICDDILQHLTSPIDTLTILKDYIRPGGVLTVTTPNIARGTARLRLLTGRNVYPRLDDQFAEKESLSDGIWKIAPYREYTLRELEMLMKNVGLELIHSEFIIGKSVNSNIWPPLPVKEYFLQKISQIIQKIVAPLRSYLFVSARRSVTQGKIGTKGKTS